VEASLHRWPEAQVAIVIGNRLIAPVDRKIGLEADNIDLSRELRYVRERLRTLAALSR
jgi:hypothetical protein